MFGFRNINVSSFEYRKGISFIKITRYVYIRYRISCSFLLLEKKYMIIRDDGDSGCPEKLKVQSNDRFGIVWTGINRPRNIALTFGKELLSSSRQTEFVVVAVLCFVVVFLRQLVYFYTCSSCIVYTKSYKNRSISVPFACY